MSESEVRAAELLFWFGLAVCAAAFIVLAVLGWLPGGGA